MTTTSDTVTFDALAAAHGGGFFADALAVLTRNEGTNPDYRTGHLAGYVEGRLAGQLVEVTAPTPAPFCPPFPLAPLDAEPAPKRRAVTLPSAAVDDIVAQSSPAPAAAEDLVAALALTAEVAAIVAQLTGYEAGMLAPDLDLEADLGIDETKRRRILAAVVDRWSLTVPEDMPLSSVPTLGRLVDLVRDPEGFLNDARTRA